MFHKRAAAREGWWANKLQTWWPQGLNVAGTGGEHKGGARNDWWRYRETYHKIWRSDMQARLEEGKAQVIELCRRIQAGDETGWEDLKKIPLDMQRQMLQAMNMDGCLGGKLRQKMEHQMREHLRQHKAAKKMPAGDFVKLLLTHKGWNAADVRNILREPEVCRVHPDPTAAERIWVCERNVPPIGSWLLNYTAMEDQDLTVGETAALVEWDDRERNRTTDEQWRDARCPCHASILCSGPEDVWKGHVCTSDVRKFKSPLVRALLLKGHAFKLENNEESLLQEIRIGLDGYITYKTKHTGDSSMYEPWKKAILTRVQEKLGKGECMLYPSGGMGRYEVAELQEHLVFPKEDRAPHVVVGMCKYRYMYERSRYLQGQTFEKVTEPLESIMKRHWNFQEERCLEPNNRLPYIYGIWKSAKRNLRWISGVRKGKEESTGSKEQQEKPRGSIAGAGQALVGLLQQVMNALKRKDGDGVRAGAPKKCWFIESVEEVAQPLRFDALEVAKHGKTAKTVDFVSMYPSFNQVTLKDRLKDALLEAWSWQQGRAEEGEVVKLSQTQWVTVKAADAALPTTELWTMEGVMELVEFVIDNGYIQRGLEVFHQVKGFGMGLACAGQIANLACYPVERDYAATRRPEEVMHNYRYIDDIHTLTGCIPAEKDYGMEYKNTTEREGQLVFLGMRESWIPYSKGTKFVTGMHFRDASYPIVIRRYPAGGSMVTDSQRIGVITGQFIRAQRLCSTLENMKEAVRGVALAAFRRGYKRRELDRQWGKFLVQWWKAEEVRRGELRAWFRKMTSEVSQTVQRENRGIFGTEVQEQGAGQVMCRFRERCWYKDRACPFAHPADRKQASKDSSTNNKEPADGMLVDEDAVQGETSASPNRCPPLPRPRCEERDIEFIPKTQGAIWHARGDGSCLYYSVLKNNDPAAAKALRRDLANYMEQQWNALIPGLTRESTVGDLVNERGSSKNEYLQSVRLGGYGVVIELLLLELMQKGRYRM